MHTNGSNRHRNAKSSDQQVIFHLSGLGFKRNRIAKFCLALALAGLTSSASYAQKKDDKKPLPPIERTKSGFVYHPDSLGNQIIDFSYSGYEASNLPIPVDLPIKIRVPLRSGDATWAIQSAINYVSKLPLNDQGFRGVVLLESGTYHVAGTLSIAASGVVLRGAGPAKGGTTLLAEGLQRDPLIKIIGKKDSVNHPAVEIQNQYLPVGSHFLQLANPSDFKVGDEVVIHRPATQKWIDLLGMKDFGGESGYLGWKPGVEDIYWGRKVTAVKADGIEVDAPITTALDKNYGLSTVNTFSWPGRISHVGIENLDLNSSFDDSREKDEDHRWMAIVANNAVDGWVRRIHFQHFAGSAVSLLEGTQRFTVEDCEATDPVSEIGGQRRYVFSTTGQQHLFQRLYSEQGYHDFSVGFMAAGPNAFVQCQGELSLNYSGPVDSWASGLLFDLVRLDGQLINFTNLGQEEQGAGWNAANSLLWNVYASKVTISKPPTAQNYGFGIWSQFGGDGYWADANNWISPRSFFYAQLAQRLGRKVDDQARLMPFQGEASSSPSVEAAAALTKEAYEPAMIMRDWIDSIIASDPLPTTATGVADIYSVGLDPKPKAPKVIPMTLSGGWLSRAGEVMTGDRQNVPWWSGTVQPDYLLSTAKPAITRYVPGREGLGLTDNLDTVTSQMQRHHVTVMEQNYALWYDRRRDDHERVRRQDGNVWLPFYELPFARSGKGTAWDGLSKYDLTKYNPYYWGRLRQFADLADQKGLVLIHHNYFQHNIIEAGAHYADFPWRPVNNINGTGFPEPVNYAADKRLFMAEQFYDETNPARRALHQAFIDQCIANFKDNHNVLQFICEEYTGPTHFAKFWLQTILDWEKKNNKTGKDAPFIGLSTTKDVQDSILQDPVLNPVVKVIDIRYWFYQKDGTAYAPKGGQNLAPRQQSRLFKPKGTDFSQVYRAVREYKDKYPDKAVMYSAASSPEYAWASFMAGGSLAQLPSALPSAFLSAATKMKPISLEGAQKGVYALASDKGDYIIFAEAGASFQLPAKAAKAHYQVQVLQPRTGRPLAAAKSLRAVTAESLSKLSSSTHNAAGNKNSGALIYWLSTK